MQCNSGRPIYKRCINTNADCIYHTEEEEIKIPALERRNSEVISELEQLRDIRPATLTVHRGGTRDLQLHKDEQDCGCLFSC